MQFGFKVHSNIIMCCLLQLSTVYMSLKRLHTQKDSFCFQTLIFGKSKLKENFSHVIFMNLHLLQLYMIRTDWERKKKTYIKNINSQILTLKS